MAEVQFYEASADAVVDYFVKDLSSTEEKKLKLLEYYLDPAKKTFILKILLTEK